MITCCVESFSFNDRYRSLTERHRAQSRKLTMMAWAIITPTQSHPQRLYHIIGSKATPPR